MSARSRRRGLPGRPVTHRDRLLAAAAARFTAEHGWGALTMGKLADLVGVSRQTVYNEIGGKPQLAEAMVMRELELFLDLVDSAFHDNPDDLVARDRGGGVPGARRWPAPTRCCTRS